MEGVSIEGDKVLFTERDKAGGVLAGPAAYHMVDDADAQNLRGFDQAAGDVAILLAGGRVAGRVVMRQNHAGRALPDRLAHDLAFLPLAVRRHVAQALEAQGFTLFPQDGTDIDQLNRNADNEGRKPGMADLRDSGQIEADADRIWILHRGANDTIELNQCKNRHGRTAQMTFDFLGRLTAAAFVASDMYIFSVIVISCLSSSGNAGSLTAGTGLLRRWARGGTYPPQTMRRLG